MDGHRPHSAALTAGVGLGLASFAFAVLAGALVFARMLQDRRDVSAAGVANAYGEALFVLLLGLFAGLLAVAARAFAASQRDRAGLRRVLIGAGLAALVGQLVLVAPFAGSVWYYALDPANRLFAVRVLVVALAAVQVLVLLGGALAFRPTDAGASQAQGADPAP